MAYVTEAYTDCIDAATSHEDTVWFPYSNENDYAGIEYYGLDIEFGLRIHGRFFVDRYPEENEAEEQSDESVDDLSNSIKSQRLLEVEPAPAYFHHQIKMALKHNQKEIDGVAVAHGEEAYEMNVIDKANPLQHGEIWLTIKDDEFFTNIYGQI